MEPQRELGCLENPSLWFTCEAPAGLGRAGTRRSRSREGHLHKADALAAAKPSQMACSGESKSVQSLGCLLTYT